MSETMECSNKKSSTLTLKTDKRFEPTKTGLVGLQRDTMLSSELQFLPQLGKAKNRGHKLPSKDFTYGVTYEKLDGGVPEALQHWINIAKDTKAREERYKLVRDFIALNKAAAQSGCVTTKENSNYRALNDIRRKIKIGGGFDGDLSRSKVNFPPGMTFGQPHRPSTPINEVLEHKYLHDWLNEMQTQEALRIAAKKEATKAISGAYHTKSSWLKNAKIAVDEKPLWKMPRFRNVEAAVDSFRTFGQRQKALSATSLDRVPRQGVNAFKQGIYTVNTTTLPC